MNTDQANKKTRVFQVIKNSEVVAYPVLDLDEWKKSINKTFLYGKKAVEKGEAPVKGKFVFTDGNVIGLRGDRYKGVLVDMVNDLHKLSLKYWREGKLKKVTIYDNTRDFDDNRIILDFEADVPVRTNLLPMYLGDVKIQK